MRIDVSFFAAKGGLNGGFTVLIIKPVNQKLDVEDYLKQSGHEELAKFFSYLAPQMDVGCFANSFLEMLCGLFDHELKPIFDSKIFQVTPIDWMGYK